MSEIELREQLLASAGLAGLYDPPGNIVLSKVQRSFDHHTANFVGAATFIALHVRDGKGNPFPLLFGGSQGFVRVINATTLRIAVPASAWPGDRLPLDGDATYEVGLLFVIPGVKETLRMKGHLAQAPDAGFALEFRLDNAFFHCAKAFIRSKLWDQPVAEETWQGLKPFRCVRKERESAVITSFYLVREDGGAPPLFSPGQHVQVEVDVPGEPAPLRRAYSLSCAPGQNELRISVKREAAPGLVSNFLHDHVEVGTSIRLGPPAGRFILREDSGRPVVLLSAGVGLTPMVSMLDHLVATGSRREIWFLHAAISGREHAMSSHVRALAARHANVHVHVCYEHPTAHDRLYGQFEAEGRLGIETLKRRLPWGDYDYYLCGPGRFMTAFIEGLNAHGVPRDRIRWEAFGPATAPASPQAGTAGTSPTAPPNVDEGPTITFARSGMSMPWTDGYTSLLEFAEAHSVPVRSICRVGDCMTCSTRILSGTVDHSPTDIELPGPGTALLCCAVPKGPLSLDL
ncbi:hypothetical protein GCM10007301_30240 [Azorhizobium oxalatiphilum]|uniref:nitric oxide dioxygenase n=1 Tax=Azorhizobium oxalatiphilum TaxID=980631 RepID=A0A917C4I5_9HYPH|nr:2Fe-2S iron-sulfur cluster-binding protein [Azorhizobium oxalatiphilum]GGF68520.1 hypothetical protein GCM10007301_30240 [Azorhizobium oxalatiphilum]